MMCPISKILLSDAAHRGFYHTDRSSSHQHSTTSAPYHKSSSYPSSHYRGGPPPNPMHHMSSPPPINKTQATSSPSHAPPTLTTPSLPPHIVQIGQILAKTPPGSQPPPITAGANWKEVEIIEQLVCDY